MSATNLFFKSCCQNESKCNTSTSSAYLSHFGEVAKHKLSCEIDAKIAPADAFCAIKIKTQNVVPADAKAFCAIKNAKCRAARDLSLNDEGHCPSDKVPVLFFSLSPLRNRNLLKFSGFHWARNAGRDSLRFPKNRTTFPPMRVFPPPGTFLNFENRHQTPLAKS